MNIFKQGILFSFIATCLLITATAWAQDLYVYPAKGQSDEQLARDRYECHSWAVSESDFDPTLLGDQMPTTVRVPLPANEAEGATEKGTLVGAVAGAAIGSHDSNAGQGAVVGAIIGSMIGAAVEEEGYREARRQAEAEAAEISRTRAEKALRQTNYRRALTACLEGRGYSVK